MRAATHDEREDVQPVPPGCECPNCGEHDADKLVWIGRDLERTRCTTCGTEYEPDAEYEYDDDESE